MAPAKALCPLPPTYFMYGPLSVFYLDGKIRMVNWFFLEILPTLYSYSVKSHMAIREVFQNPILDIK